MLAPGNYAQNKPICKTHSSGSLGSKMESFTLDSDKNSPHDLELSWLLNNADGGLGNSGGFPGQDNNTYNTYTNAQSNNSNTNNNNNINNISSSAAININNSGSQGNSNALVSSTSSQPNIGGGHMDLNMQANDFSMGFDRRNLDLNDMNANNSHNNNNGMNTGSFGNGMTGMGKPSPRDGEGLQRGMMPGVGSMGSNRSAFNRPRCKSAGSVGDPSRNRDFSSRHGMLPTISSQLEDSVLLNSGSKKRAELRRLGQWGRRNGYARW
ncbi:hypothetical protein, variant [Sphaeroforma arctica JP610]|uniref:Uncharacterized protein n=1 Tax=Sphaeroforma arctica JP610 TaxID=667725 RepID=A0A0L0FL98_9EUKA|nr:hypothetical protein, variant [Sphaeroforma arctica JP610]KNC76788.1 hypothetical protein, variant [Sphaeroforma arctica JP610]|eukprot:XP_014150690.1 hypothetical protein, variant [Sphaeroforma arctica JP610]